jgi:hypothetical protein
MKVFSRIVLCLLAAMSLPIALPRAAQVELLPDATVRVGINASSSQRIAVDVSSNLVNWTQMTNVAPLARQITFANDPSQSDPMRFFRISDGDETFAIAGYVDGGQYFRGMAGVTMTEGATGTTVLTDANGFFHFDQRFSRTNLPFLLTASIAGAPIAQQQIAGAQAGVFSVIQAPLATRSPDIYPVDTTCHFKVTGGPRAGLEYTIQFYDTHFQMTGGITGAGIFQRSVSPPPTSLYLTNSTGTNAASDPYLWGGSTNVNTVSGWFSGIPSAKGALAGNGTVTMERVVVAPTNLAGMAFSIGDGEIQFTDTQYVLTWDGVTNTYYYFPSRDGNFWNISSKLQLYFLSATNGSFTFLQQGPLVITGDMHQIPFTLLPDTGVPAPATPPTLNITTTNIDSGIGSGAQYTLVFSGGTTGTFTTVNSGMTGNGSYTYTVYGSNAHLYLSYGAPFVGDYDNMTLTFKAPQGSGTPNSFSGTQQVGGTIYPFLGIFTY